MEIAFIYMFAETKVNISVICPINILFNGDVVTATKRKYLYKNGDILLLHPEFTIVLICFRHWEYSGKQGGCGPCHHWSLLSRGKDRLRRVTR